MPSTKSSSRSRSSGNRKPSAGIPSQFSKVAAGRIDKKGNKSEKKVILRIPQWGKYARELQKEEYQHFEPRNTGDMAKFIFDLYERPETAKLVKSVKFDSKISSGIFTMLTDIFMQNIHTTSVELLDTAENYTLDAFREVDEDGSIPDKVLIMYLANIWEIAVNVEKVVFPREWNSDLFDIYEVFPKAKDVVWV